MSDKDNEQLEATTPDEELELEDNLDDTEDVEALKEKLEKANTFARQSLARAKKAEAALKDKPVQANSETVAKPTQVNNSNTLTPDDIDARVLRLQGMPEPILEALKKVAKINGQTLMEAQSDEVFVAMKAKIEEQDKSEKAKLGASRGTGSVKKAKTFNTSGLSDAEHKEMWLQAQGR